MNTRFLTLLLIILIAIPVIGQSKKIMTMKESLLLPSISDVSWSPQGDYIVYTKSMRDSEDFEQSRHIWVYKVLSGFDMQLTYSHKGEDNPQWIGNSEIVFTSERDGKKRMYKISVSGGEARPLVDDKKAPADGTLSPDGLKIAYTKMSDRVDKEEWDKKKEKKDDGYFWEEKLTFRHIWVYDIASKTSKRITSKDFDNTNPVWSPDNKWLAFTSNRSGIDFRNDKNTDIFVAPADSGRVRQFTTNKGPDSNPVFSPDGNRIAYLASERESHWADHMEVMVVPFSGGSAVNLTEEFDYSASSLIWSKNGETVYFYAGMAPTGFLHKAFAKGGKIEKVSSDDEFVYSGFQLSKDGTKWLFTGSSVATAGEVFTSSVEFASVKNIVSATNHMEEYKLAREEVVRWKGPKGWEINGILTYPLDYEKGKKYPTILMVHGGPYGQFRKTFYARSQIWAARGYAVIRGNPRGSSGHTFEFGMANNEDWGGNDFKDVMAGVDHAIKLGIADPDRLAIMGGSYGGFMTFWGITQTDRFKAAIGHAAIADWFSFFGQSDIPDLMRHGFGGYPWEAKKTFEKYSPIEYIENVRTPILITHGDQDFRVNLQQGWQYYRSLMLLNKKVKFLRFPREGHGIREPLHQLQLDREQEKWMAEHLMPEKYAELLKNEVKK